MTSVRVKMIVTNWDMRGVHKLRNKSKRLGSHECVVAFNKKQTIARIIDGLGGVHTYYAQKNEVFDIDVISVMMEDVFYVKLELGKNTENTARKLAA